MTIVYHGLGYVGLTGAVHFAQVGVDTLGYDPDEEVTIAINAGKPRAGDFLQYLSDVDYRQHFKATSNFSDVLKTRAGLNGLHSVHILAVPSEKNGEPWMALVLRCIKQLADELPLADADTHHLIIVESTCSPGTLDEAKKEIDREDILLAAAPRRDWFADPKKNLSTIKRVVGGVGHTATFCAVRVLQHVTPADNIIVTDHKTAELVKPLENALFHLPIMLGHELALTYPNHNIAEALSYAVTHWRFESFGGLYIGLGSGGRCIPLGAKYLNSNFGKSTLLSNAVEIDKCMPMHVADSAIDAHCRLVESTATNGANRIKSALILGAAYRPGFRDAGLSPGLRIAKEFQVAAHTACVIDPVFTSDEITAMGAKPSRIEDINEYDIVVLATAHKEFLDLPSWEGWKPYKQVIVDAQGHWKNFKAHFEGNGCVYLRVGEAGWRG
jgi:UDP-N-acetyl-D-glucosamine dehydrogenase